MALLVRLERGGHMSLEDALRFLCRSTSEDQARAQLKRAVAEGCIAFEPRIERQLLAVSA